MTHAIVHLPGDPEFRPFMHGDPNRWTWSDAVMTDIIGQHAAMTDRALGLSPSRPSLTIEVALTTHQVPEPHDGDRD